MITNEIDSETFKDLFIEGLDGIYIFVMNDCFLCERHMEFLNKENCIREVNLVNVLEDSPYFLAMGIDDMPLTRVYQKGLLKWEKSGQFFDKQLKELMENL